MKEKTNKNTIEAKGKDAPRILTLDIEKYQSYLDDADLTEDQKEEFLKALWSIIVAFVDLGFAVKPQDHCGQDAVIAALNDTKSAASGTLNTPKINTKFLRAADRKSDPVVRGGVEQ